MCGVSTIVIDCNKLHKISTAAFNKDSCFDDAYEQSRVDSIYQLHSESKRYREEIKKRRNMLHNRMHELKRIVLHGKMNNMPLNKLREHEDELEKIKSELGYHNIYKHKTPKTPYKVFGTKPYQGGGFSPR